MSPTASEAVAPQPAQETPKIVATGSAASTLTRRADLDVMRVLACLAVVALHASGRTIYAYDTVDAVSWGVADLIDSATRWCVPVFVMISGALLLNRPIGRPRDFLWRKAQRIIPLILFWSFAYFAWRRFYHRDPIDMAVIAKDLFFATPYYHLYFLSLIGGLYAVTPALRRLMERIPEHTAAWSAYGMLALAFCAAAANVWTPNAFTFFVPYLGYFLLGALMVRHATGPRSVFLSVWAIAVLLTAVGTAITVHYWGPLGTYGLYFYGFHSPTVIPMAIAVFGSMRGISISAGVASLAARLAPATLGVYLVHPMVLEVVRSRIGDADLLVPWHIVDIPVIFLLVIVISTALVLVVRKIPFVRALA
jgi:surface polysaccharide O-acyltransferase-like enzyme